MSKVYGLEHWGMGENGVEVYSEDKKIKVSITHERMGISINDDDNMNTISKSISSMHQIISSMSCMSETKIRRIGIRTRSCFEYRDTFHNLFNKFRSNYMNISEPLANAFDFKIYDIGYPLNYQKDDVFMHTNSGPMQKAQIIEYFSEYYADTSVPEVGIYTDVDVFEVYEKMIKKVDYEKKIQEFMTVANDRKIQMYKMIVGE